MVANHDLVEREGLQNVVLMDLSVMLYNEMHGLMDKFQF